MNALRETKFTLPGQTAFYRGKVRDVYSLGDQLIMVASDRISAFDHILPRPIPYKGAVLNQMAEMMKGSEDMLSEQTAKMLGQDDPFSKAMIENQLKNIDKQFEALMQTGFPEEMRAYLGMMGFKVVINYHGDVVRVEQPGSSGSDEGE